MTNAIVNKSQKMQTLYIIIAAIINERSYIEIDIKRIKQMSIFQSSKH